MDVNQKVFSLKKIKIFLIFFVGIHVQSCMEPSESMVIKVEYENQKAIFITFYSTKNPDNFKLYLNNQNTKIIGKFSSKDETITFTPVIPFTPGLQYELKYNNNTQSFFTVDSLINAAIPELLAIYPSTDTVPVNMLKMYFYFSEPMQEIHNSLDYITVFNLTEQKGVTIFLELQPELWNKEHTRLTLWLDPGRIKTGLIPNQKMGLPLLQSNSYRIDISKNWKNANNIELAHDYSKKLFIKSKDGDKPTVNKWNINPPEHTTIKPLIIDFNENMDAILALETLSVFNANMELIKGEFILKNNERMLEFIPDSQWEKGNYTILIESRLEDLAGNNLNHAFDVDLKTDSIKKEFSTTPNLSFEIL